MTEPVVIGDAQLWLGDCREILPTLGRVEAVVTELASDGDARFLHWQTISKYNLDSNRRYFDIACRRIEQAYAQPDLFVAPPANAVQEKML